MGLTWAPDSIHILMVTIGNPRCVLARTDKSLVIMRQVCAPVPDPLAMQAVESTTPAGHVRSLSAHAKCRAVHKAHSTPAMLVPASLS